jgi:hypothetical protein
VLGLAEFSAGPSKVIKKKEVKKVKKNQIFHLSTL